MRLKTKPNRSWQALSAKQAQWLALLERYNPKPALRTALTVRRNNGTLAAEASSFFSFKRILGAVSDYASSQKSRCVFSTLEDWWCNQWVVSARKTC
eukprot:449357-Amphidinium_carterae.1